MVQGVEALPREAADGSGSLINDFQLIVATINGTGSQTSNTAIIRSLFKMGIPVNGKNIFPSNIQGLPTWFTIRVSKDGYIARLEDNAILVAMNPNTAVQDAQELAPGGICLYDEVFTTDQRYRSFGFVENRPDITYFPMPIDQIVTSAEVPKELVDRVRNMAYVGILAYLIDIDLEAVEYALHFHFGGKERAIRPNMQVITTAHDWAAEHYASPCPYKVVPMQETSGKFLLDGNSAAALGAAFGGLSLLAWYPITPSTSLADAAKDYLEEFRIDRETGKPTFAIIQAEDELAAIGMVIGAGWAGARAMTATSGPGISLMTEFTGLAYFAEIPAVIWDVQRMGPSTGLPTRVSQGDVMAAHFLGHGDSRHPVLFPSSLKECFEFGWKAFDLAEELQTPVFVLTDLDLGMNLWMTEPFDYPDQPMKRGKILTADDLEALKGDWGRYRDVDGDGVGYRTLPGTEHWSAAYFTRGTGHDENANYSERADHWTRNLDRLARKFNTARRLVPAPLVEHKPGASIGLIAYGTSDAAIAEARDQLSRAGLTTGYLRIRALPFNDAVPDFIGQFDSVYVIENNYDGQMAKLILMEYPRLADRIKSLSKCDGWPLTAHWIANAVEEQEEKK